MSIAFRELQPSDRRGGPERGPAVEAKFKGETFTIKFSQRSRPAERAGGAKLRKENSWAKDFESQPSEKLTFSIAGNVYGAEKVWQGTQAKLESLVDEIVRGAFELVPLQVELRKQREAAAERAQRAAEVRAAAERRASAKTEQLKQAFLMAEADARVRQLEEFLTRLESGIDDLAAPYSDHAGVWIQVVREQLAAKHPVDEMLARCLSAPSWGTWPPD